MPRNRVGCRYSLPSEPSAYFYSALTALNNFTRFCNAPVQGFHGPAEPRNLVVLEEVS
jgi:hypothetical protein